MSSWDNLRVSYLVHWRKTFWNSAARNFNFNFMNLHKLMTSHQLGLLCLYSLQQCCIFIWNTDEHYIGLKQTSSRKSTSLLVLLMTFYVCYACLFDFQCDYFDAVGIMIQKKNAWQFWNCWWTAMNKNLVIWSSKKSLGIDVLTQVEIFFHVSSS